MSNPLPILKFTARHGTLSTVDWVCDEGGQVVSRTTNITDRQPRFAIDFGSLEIGWACYRPSLGWRWRVVPFGVEIPSRPAPEYDSKDGETPYREAARLYVAGRDIGGVRGLGGNAEVLLTSLKALHATYRASPEAEAGMIPLVWMPHTHKVERGGYTLHQPVFVIERWVERPPHLGRRLVPPPNRLREAGFRPAHEGAGELSP